MIIHSLSFKLNFIKIMHPFLKIFVKLLAIIFMLFLAVQINNFFCLNFNKCRPFYLSFYYNRFIARKYEHLKLITNYSIINLNKNVGVTVDFDKTTSKIGEIVKINVMLKNLTKYEIVVQNNFLINDKIIEKFMTILQCPCYSKISLKPNESKMITIEFFYNILVSKKTSEEIGKIISRNTPFNDEFFIINNTQLIVK